MVDCISARHWATRS